MVKPLIIIDAGHGGFDPKTNEYTTKGKLHVWPTFTVFEGVVNRAIACELITLLHNHGYATYQVNHDWYDNSLTDRVRAANSYRGRSLYVSIHNNAGGGHGMEVFTYYGYSEADELATEIYKAWGEVLPDQRQRKDYSDGDPDKESAFYVLKHTNMPAVLVECGFMDNETDARFMVTTAGQKAYAKAIFEGIDNYCNEKTK